MKKFLYSLLLIFLIIKDAALITFLSTFLFDEFKEVGFRNLDYKWFMLLFIFLGVSVNFVLLIFKFSGENKN